MNTDLTFFNYTVLHGYTCDQAKDHDPIIQTTGIFNFNKMTFCRMFTVRVHRTRIHTVHSAAVRMQHHRCQAMFGTNDYRDLVGECRSDFEYQDADDYFNCMGMLAAEGTYHRLDEWVDAGVDPIDMILLMACEQDDYSKVEEVLNAGANQLVQDPRNGKAPVDLCSDDEVRALLLKN